jgi:hypothetical protein
VTNRSDTKAVAKPGVTESSSVMWSVAKGQVLSCTSSEGLSSTRVLPSSASSSSSVPATNRSGSVAKGQVLWQGLEGSSSVCEGSSSFCKGSSSVANRSSSVTNVSSYETNWSGSVAKGQVLWRSWP